LYGIMVCQEYNYLFAFNGRKLIATYVLNLMVYPESFWCFYTFK